MTRKVTSSEGVTCAGPAGSWSVRGRIPEAASAPRTTSQTARFALTFIADSQRAGATAVELDGLVGAPRSAAGPTGLIPLEVVAQPLHDISPARPLGGLDGFTLGQHRATVLP